MRTLTELRNTTRGAAFVEYSILVGLIGIISISSIFGLVTNVSAAFSSSSDIISDPTATQTLEPERTESVPLLLFVEETYNLVYYEDFEMFNMGEIEYVEYLRESDGNLDGDVFNASDFASFGRNFLFTTASNPDSVCYSLGRSDVSNAGPPEMFSAIFTSTENLSTFGDPAFFGSIDIAEAQNFVARTTLTDTFGLSGSISSVEAITSITCSLPYYQP